MPEKNDKIKTEILRFAEFIGIRFTRHNGGWIHNLMGKKYDRQYLTIEKVYDIFKSEENENVSCP